MGAQSVGAQSIGAQSDANRFVIYILDYPPFFAIIFSHTVRKKYVNYSNAAAAKHIFFKYL